jgi:hypothetical protein
MEEKYVDEHNGFRNEITESSQKRGYLTQLVAVNLIKIHFWTTNQKLDYSL